MNNVSLIGRLTRDPELREMPDGGAVCDIRLAVNDGKEDQAPLYVDVASFGKQATACAEYLRKGRQVAVSGKLIYREWESDDGSKHSKHSVLGRVEFLSGNKADNGSEPVAAGAEGAGESEDAEDIPF